MDEKLAALLEDLMARAYDPGSNKYDFRETNRVVQEHFEKLINEKNNGRKI